MPVVNIGELDTASTISGRTNEIYKIAGRKTLLTTRR